MTRRPLRLPALAGLALVAAACEQQPQTPPAPDADPSLYQIETVVEGLDLPWGLAFLPDGGLLVTERSGALRLVRDGVLQPDPVAGGPEDVFFGGQGGLLDVALSPDFEETGLIYLTYAAGEADANTPALFRARFDGARLSDGETIFRADPLRSTEHHYGGRMAFVDGAMFLTLGDGFLYREEAQLRDNHLGAIVRLTADGAPAPDNPFAAEGGPAASIYSYGHRNVQGIAIDPRSGTIWTHEHGPRGGDELNRLEPGANYGWPIATEGIDYNGARISPFFNHDGYAAPAHVWTPSIAPSGLAFYDGGLFEDWEGDLFVSALSGRAVHRVDLSEDGAVLGEERLFAELEQRIRHVATGPDGALWLLTDSPEGRVLRVTPPG